MQVTEFANEGLKRGYNVVVPASDIAAGRDRRLAVLGRDLRLPGFRPGKVPASVVKQRYGAAVMTEVLDEQVGEATRKVVSDRGLRPALQPKVELVSFVDGGDLEFKVELELLPEIPLPDFSGIALERPKAVPTDAEIDTAIQGIAARNRSLTDVEPGRPAAKGEVLVCDFVGRLANQAVEALPPVVAPQDEAKWPAGWGHFADRGLTGSLLWTRTVDGVVTSEVAFSGTVEANARGYVFFSDNAGVAVPEGEITGAWNWSLVSGTLPEKTQSAMLIGVRDAERKGIAGGGLERGFDLPGSESSRPSIKMLPVFPETPVSLRFAAGLIFPAGEIDVVLRVSAPSITTNTGLAEPFPGGSMQDMPIEVGGDGFIPGFTDQIEGLAPGESRAINVTFPDPYNAPELAGKAAVFEITAKKLQIPVPPVIDDAFAVTLGVDDLATLKTRLVEGLQREYDSLARMKVKRALLDALSAQTDFEVPESMVESEFAQIWQRVEADLKAGRLDSDDAGKDEETLKADYRAIAARRIRLGLLLSEVGRVNGVQVTPEEMNRAVFQEAQRYPGQEKQVLDFFRKNPEAADNLRGPIFEDKVVDFMLELAKVTDREVSVAELTAMPATA